MKYMKFEELPVWNAAIELADKSFKMCDDKSFRFQGDLSKQLTKAALSVSNNIAEGFERNSTRELLMFLYIARGSNGETRSMLYVLARNNRYDHLEPERLELQALVTTIGKQLKGWIDSLNARKTETQKLR